MRGMISSGMRDAILPHFFLAIVAMCGMTTGGCAAVGATVRELKEVAAELALTKNGIPMWMQKLDRIFQRYDVNGLRLI